MPGACRRCRVLVGSALAGGAAAAPQGAPCPPRLALPGDRGKQARGHRGRLRPRGRWAPVLQDLGPATAPTSAPRPRGPARRAAGAAALHPCAIVSPAPPSQPGQGRGVPARRRDHQPSAPPPFPPHSPRRVRLAARCLRRPSAHSSRWASGEPGRPGRAGGSPEGQDKYQV